MNKFSVCGTRKGGEIVIKNLAMGFHDVFAYVAIVFAVSCWIVYYVYGDEYYKRISRIFILAATSFLFINIIDFIYYKPVGFLGPADKLPASFDILNVLSDLSQILSASIRVAFWGVNENLSTKLSASQLLSWNFTESLFVASVICSAGFVLMYCAFHFNGIKTPRKFVSIIYSMSAIFVIINTLYFGRGMLRSMEYLYESSYYFYLITPFWLLLGVVVISRFETKRCAQIVLVTLTLFLCALRIYNIKSAISPVVQFTQDCMSDVKCKLTSKPNNSTISATSILDDFGPQGLFIEQAPGWHAKRNPEYPQTLTIDFKKKKSFEFISFLPQDKAHIARAPKTVRITISSDGQFWDTVVQGVNMCSSNSPGGWHQINLPNRTEAQYLKIDILSNCGDPEFLTLRGLKIE